MPSNEEVVNEHTRALLAHDRKALVEGYADDAVFLVGPTPIMGKDAIRAMFESLPDDALPTEVTIDLMVSHGEYMFVTYHHEGTQGGDTFHIRDGKIVMQSACVINVPAELSKSIDGI